MAVVYSQKPKSDFSIDSLVGNKSIKQEQMSAEIPDMGRISRFKPFALHHMMADKDNRISKKAERDQCDNSNCGYGSPPRKQSPTPAEAPVSRRITEPGFPSNIHAKQAAYSTSSDSPISSVSPPGMLPFCRGNPVSQTIPAAFTNYNPMAAFHPDTLPLPPQFSFPPEASMLVESYFRPQIHARESYPLYPWLLHRGKFSFFHLYPTIHLH